MGGVAGTCGLLAETPISILNPRNQARSASSKGGAVSDSICKEIDAEDVGAMTPCGLPAAMDSAPTPNATSLMQLWNQLIPNPTNQADLQVQEEEQIQEIEAEGVGVMTP